MSHEFAPRLGEFTNELTALQPLDLDQPSLDRNALRWRVRLSHQAVGVANVLFELSEVFALAHDTRNLDEPANQPPVIFPVLEGEGPHGESIAPAGALSQPLPGVGRTPEISCKGRVALPSRTLSARAYPVVSADHYL